MEKIEQRLDYCLKCNICHTQCPVVAKHINFPGPKNLGPELERLELAQGSINGLLNAHELAYCTNCKRCDMACPHDVRPSNLNLKHKAKLNRAVRDKFRDWILANNYRWGKLARPVAPLANFVMKQKLTKGIFSTAGITSRRPMPLYDNGKLAGNVPGRAAGNAKKVLYFVGCYATYFDNQVARSTMDVMKYLGYQVELAPLICCGTPVFSNGFIEHARALALKNINTFTKYLNEGYRIITSCPSCSLAFKVEYAEVLGVEGAKEVSKEVWDTCELLQYEGLDIKDKAPSSRKLYYHAPCHLKAQGIGTPAVSLLGNVFELVVNDDVCCGMAGTFGYKKDKYQLSMEIGSQLFSNIGASQCLEVITDCGMCKSQIIHATGKQVIHPVCLIDEIIKGEVR